MFSALSRKNYWMEPDKTWQLSEKWLKLLREGSIFYIAMNTVLDFVNLTTVFAKVKSGTKTDQFVWQPHNKEEKENINQSLKMPFIPIQLITNVE